MNIGNLTASKGAYQHGFRFIDLLCERVDFVAHWMAPPAAMYRSAHDTNRKRGFKPLRRLKDNAVVSNEIHRLA